MPLEDTINELKHRIEKLENKHEEDFAYRISQLKVSKEKETEKKKEEELKNVLSLFQDGLETNKISHGGRETLPLIVEYAVNFVEKFWLLISKILGIVINDKHSKGSFKLDICLNLISEFFDFNEEDHPFIKNLINIFVKLIFNTNKYEVAKDIESLNRKNKKYGSMRKLSKIFIRN